jgi:hypothetical protein
VPRDTAILIQAFQAEGARQLRVDDDAEAASKLQRHPPIHDVLPEVAPMDSSIVVSILAFAIPLALILLMVWKMLPGKAKIKVPMPGTLHITGTSERARNAAYQSATITGVLSAEGLDARPVTLETMVATSKLPYPGTVVPVVYCRRDPTQVKILWKEVPTADDQAQQMAQRLAEELNRQSRR